MEEAELERFIASGKAPVGDAEEWDNAVKVVLAEHGGGDHA
jgi:hypothetical protein